MKCRLIFFVLLVVGSLAVFSFNYLEMDVHKYIAIPSFTQYTTFASNSSDVAVAANVSSDVGAVVSKKTLQTTVLSNIRNINKISDVGTGVNKVVVKTKLQDNNLRQGRTSSRKLCPKKPPNFGKGKYFPITFENITLEELKVKYKASDVSGRFRPSNCRASEKVAIIIPYRDRERHLHILLNNLIPFLILQQSQFTVFVIEQAPGTIFNRGLLLNIGFVESLKQDNYTCFIMHDVDSIPEVNDNLYRCSSNPLHMSTASSKNSFKLPYASYTGGTLAFRKDQYKKINGFSNYYFGWGGEDDDVEIRIKRKHMRVEKLSYSVGRYQSIPHGTDKGNPVNSNKGKLFRGLVNRIPIDGISSLHYKSTVEFRQLYTRILVHINMTFHEVKFR